MNTADTTENTEKKTSALPAKKVSDSETVSGASSAEDCWSGSMK